MKTRPNGWQVYEGRDQEKEARNLKRRFQVVSDQSFSRRSFRKPRHLSWTGLIGLAVLVAVATYLVYSWAWNSNLWPSKQALLQSRYVHDCASARQIGVAPLYRGFPGYRDILDRDRDGIACEPYPF